MNDWAAVLAFVATGVSPPASNSNIFKSQEGKLFFLVRSFRIR
jgi:hypothetical protein